jgi:hypothetical protein
MHPDKTVESPPREIAAAVRTVFPKHTPKMLARTAGVPIATAKEWLYRRFSGERRRELARLLLAELDRQDAEERAQARELLQQMAGGQ